MQKMNCWWGKCSVALCTIVCTIWAMAAEPLAMWTRFSELSATKSLVPQGSFVANNIDAANWSLALNGGFVDGEKLHTGTGVAPTVSFGTTITAGYNTGVPLTVLAVVRGTPSLPLEKPFFLLNKDTTGIGLALKTFDADAKIATLTGCWGNSAWQHNNADSRVFPQANALTGSNPVCLALTSGGSPNAAMVLPVGETAVARTNITGLQGTGINVSDLYLGNFRGATSGGMDYTLERLAIFRGNLTDDDLVNFVNNNTLIISSDVVCKSIPAGMTVVAAGGAVDLSEAEIGENVTLKVNLSAYLGVGRTFILPKSWTKEIIVEGELPDETLSFDASTGIISLLPMPTVPWQLTWMPMGDSITEGEVDMGHPERGDINSRGGYRYQLWKVLEDAGQDTRAVGFRTGHCGSDEAEANPDWAWHCGLYGGRIKPIGNSGCQWYNVESALENAGYPDVITLMLGINDLSNASDNDADIQKVFTAWTELVEKLAVCRPQSKVVVATLLPVKPGNASYNRFGPFNDKMRAAAQNKTVPFNHENVMLVDVCRLAFNDTYDASFYKGDGVHPNENGSIRVAYAFRRGFDAAIDAIKKDALKIVHVHNGVAGEVRVRLTQALTSVSEITLALSGTDVAGEDVSVALTGGAINPEDAHEIIFKTTQTFRGGTYSATLTGNGQTQGTEAAQRLMLEASGAAVELLGVGARDNVKKDFLRGFRRLSSVRLGDNDNFGGNGPTDVIAGEIDAGEITRVGYYLELKRANKPAQFVWVSMDAAAFDNEAAKVGVPSASTGKRKAIVANLAVFGNRGNFEKSVTGGRGIIEFTPYTWSEGEESGYVNEAAGGKFGWNDTLAASGNYYGCMQVARIREGAKGDWTDPAAEMLFAYNKFNTDNASDLGIGSFSAHRNNSGSASPAAVYDWTHFSSNVGYIQYLPSAYEIKTLEIWVEPANQIVWTGSRGNVWDTTTENWQSAGGSAGTYADGKQVVFADIANAPAVTVTPSGTVSPASILVDNDTTAYTLGGVIGGTGTLLKRGGGTLVLTGANTFSGGVIIEGGTVAESGVRQSLQSALGTGKNGSWATQITLRKGVFDLNGTENYRNSNQRAYWGWLSLQSLNLGGLSGSTMEVRNGVMGIGANPAIVYDAANNPGTATISANYSFSGSSSSTTRIFNIADSAATETEVDFTGGLHDNNWLDGQYTIIEKTGAGTMQLSSRFGFAQLKITEGTVRMNCADAIMSRATVTLNGGTLDLNGFDQTLASLSGSGTLTASKSATLTLSGASTLTCAISGAVGLKATAALTLTGEIDTSEPLMLGAGSRVTLPVGTRLGGIVNEGGKIVLDVNVDSLALLPEGEYPLLRLSENAQADWSDVVEVSATLPPHIRLGTLGNGAYGAIISHAYGNLIVMPLGDSITHGTSIGVNYRAPLLEGLYRDGWNVRSTGFWTNLYDSAKFTAYAPKAPNCQLHNGISGQRIMTANNRAGYLQSIDNYLSAAGYPDVITLMIGTNDAGGDPTVAFAQWKKLIRHIIELRPNTWLIVSPIIATQTQNAGNYVNDAFRPNFNSSIKDLFILDETTLTVNGESVKCVQGTLNEEGTAIFGANAKVRMASMFDAIGLPASGNNPYLYDGLHPNAAGYARMAAVWRAAIERIATREGGLNDELKAVAAYTPEGELARVTVVFNHDIRLDDATLTVGGRTATNLTLSDDGRRLTGTLETPLTLGTDLNERGRPCRLTATLATPLAAGAETEVCACVRRVGHTQTETATVVFAPVGKGAAVNVQATANGWRRVINTPAGLPTATTTRDATAAAFTRVDNAPTAFAKIAYYMELARADGELRYVWVAANKFQNADAFGLPAAKLQTRLSGLRVLSNVLVSTGSESEEGIVAFNPYSAAQGNGSSDIPSGLGNGQWFDWNDTLNASGSYGVMQFYRLTGDTVENGKLAAETLFAFNRWTGSDNNEVLIGDLATHSSGSTASINGIYLHNYTTQGAVSFGIDAYKVRNMEVWVLPFPPKPNEATDKDDATAYTDEAAEILTSANGGNLPARIVAYVGHPSYTLNAAQVSDALNCFTGIVSSDGQGVVTVAYDFNVADLEVTDAVATVTVRVTDARGGESAADFRDGAALGVVALNDARIDTLAITDITPATAAAGTRIFSFPRPSMETFLFKVALTR